MLDLYVAREEVREQARIIDELSQMAHQSGLDQTEEGAEAIASDLVYSFLLPEVQRQSARDAVQRHQQRLITAAHRVSTCITLVLGGLGGLIA